MCLYFFNIYIYIYLYSVYLCIDISTCIYNMYISLREKLTNKQCTDFSQNPVSWRGDFFTCRVLKGPWSYVVILVTRTGESAQISKHINASIYLYLYISIYLCIYISIVPSNPTFPHLHLFRRCEKTASPWES